MKVTVKGKEYTISNDEIKAGDLVYNRNAHVIDKCLAIYEDSIIGVEFDNGGRSTFRIKHYKKAVKE
jgi:hypothetical protein